LFINLTPFIPLSLKRRGGRKRKRGLPPLLATRIRERAVGQNDEMCYAHSHHIRGAAEEKFRERALHCITALPKVDVHSCEG